MVLFLQNWEGFAKRWSVTRSIDRSPRFEVEILEPRFLLDAKSFGTSFGDMGISGANGEVVASITPTVPGPGPSTNLDGWSVKPNAGGRIDSFAVPPQGGHPGFEIQLRWGGGSDPSAGSLLVLDRSGATLFDLPLVGVSELRTSLPIPPFQPGDSTSAVLEVDLMIRKGASGSADRGSYQLTVTWEGGLLLNSSPPTGSVCAVSGTATTTGSYRFVSGSESVLGQSSSTTEAILPPPPAPVISVSGPLPTGTMPTPTTGPIPFPIGRILGSLFSPPLGSPSSVGGASIVPTPGTVARQPSIVGPLPLGPSMADGGIFERSFAPIVSRNANISFGPTKDDSVAASRNLEATIHPPGPLESHGPAFRFPKANRLNLPLKFGLDRRGVRSPRPSEVEIAEEARAAISAILPSIAGSSLAFQKADPPRSSDRLVASGPPRRSRSTTPLLLALIGSGVFTMEMARPGCASVFNAWREERRRKR